MPWQSLASSASASRQLCLFSNGTYSVMLCDSGSGFSRWRDQSVTRWREDSGAVWCGRSPGNPWVPHHRVMQ